MDVNNCKRKFKDLFDKFFKEDFELSVYYSENLIKYLDNDPDKHAGKVIETPFFFELIMNSLVNLEEASESVRLFIVQVLRIMLRNELQFSKFHASEGLKLSAQKILMNDDDGHQKRSWPAMKYATAQLLKAVFSHSSGIYWAIENKGWEKMIQQDLLKEPHKYENAVYDCISTLVWKLNEYNLEATLIEVLNFLTNPIKNIVCQYFSIDNLGSTLILDTDGEESVFSPIITKLRALLAILSDTENITRENIVIPILTNHLMIEHPLRLLLKATRHTDFVYLIARVIFRLNFANNMTTNLGEIDVFPKNIPIYCNILNIILDKRLTRAYLQFTVSCITFWSKIEENRVTSTFERHERTYEVQNQFLTGLLTPLIAYSSSLYKGSEPIMNYLGAFYNKLSNLQIEQVFKINHEFKLAHEHSDEQLKSTAIEAAKQLFSVTKCLTESQAGVVYQTLFYVLQRYVTDENGTLTVDESPAKCPEDVKLFSLVLELIKTLLKEYDIKWYESVEIISLQNLLMNLLKQNLLPSKQLLQALDLIDLSIKKFLSPDLALLIKSRKGNTLDEIVVVTKNLMQHPEWELRDSALHLLLSCTDLAYVQYMPLQKLIEENGLIELATHAAIHDEETYVQTTALRTLAAATKIECLWNQALLAKPNLITILINMLRKHSEGTIREEAANVLSEVCSHQKIYLPLINCLYNVMTPAVLEDLHWEVQLAALRFWELTIKNIFSCRGMIDGKFPSVTFCPERRKIIKLDTKEIERQLIRSMNDLAHSGCLLVLNKCLSDEHNIQVMENAYSITEHLTSMLDSYEFKSVPKNMIVLNNKEHINQDVDMLNKFTNSLNFTNRSQVTGHDIIESIINTSQCELIQNLYENNLEVKADTEDEDIMMYTVDKWMDPNDFLKDFRTKNYAALIHEKKNWNSGPQSLEVLLDELLALGEVNREFGEDCD